MPTKVEGLTLECDESKNLLNIDKESKFVNSLIKVNGNNNTINIKKSLVYRSLNIDLRGNNKSIFIDESHKVIHNLKISSHRGDNQEVRIGKDLGCGGCILYLNDGDESITIGDDCLFAWGIDMRTSDGHSLIDLSTGKAINLPKPIKIGDRVWIGQNAHILKGSEINRNSVVAFGSIVTKKFTETNIVIGGNPASIIKRNIDWHRERPKRFNELMEEECQRQ